MTLVLQIWKCKLTYFVIINYRLIYEVLKALGDDLDPFVGDFL